MTPGVASIAALLKARSGLVVGPEKLYLLESRLEPILRREGLRDLEALAERIRQSSGAGRAEQLVQDVIEAMVTHESLFFRDGRPFEHLRREVLPALHRARPPGQPLRIWSAACSFGQEAYSLAMVLREGVLAGRPAKVIGTDISHSAVARARAGVYTRFEVQRGLPPRALLEHFDQIGEQWRVRDSLRALVEFRTCNLLSGLASLGQFDVAFCRNVLIYFDEPTKARVLDAIARQMAPDGWIYLGAAETAQELSPKLVAAGPDRTAYRPAAQARCAA